MLVLWQFFGIVRGFNSPRDLRELSLGTDNNASNERCVLNRSLLAAGFFWVAPDFGDATKIANSALEWQYKLQHFIVSLLGHGMLDFWVLQGYQINYLLYFLVFFPFCDNIFGSTHVLSAGCTPSSNFSSYWPSNLERQCGWQKCGTLYVQKGSTL